MDKVFDYQLKEFSQQVFIKLGLPEEDANVAANVLVQADLRGYRLTEWPLTNLC